MSALDAKYEAAARVGQLPRLQEVLDAAETRSVLAPIRRHYTLESDDGPVTEEALSKHVAKYAALAEKRGAEKCGVGKRNDQESIDMKNSLAIRRMTGKCSGAVAKEIPGAFLEIEPHPVFFPQPADFLTGRLFDELRTRRGEEQLGPENGPMEIDVAVSETRSLLTIIDKAIESLTKMPRVASPLTYFRDDHPASKSSCMLPPKVHIQQADQAGGTAVQDSAPLSNPFQGPSLLSPGFKSLQGFHVRGLAAEESAYKFAPAAFGSKRIEVAKSEFPHANVPAPERGYYRPGTKKTLATAGLPSSEGSSDNGASTETVQDLVIDPETGLPEGYEFVCMMPGCGPPLQEQKTKKEKRNCVANYFGHNKIECREVKWVTICCRHCYNIRFYAPTWKSTLKLDLILKQLNSIAEQYPDSKYAISLRKSEQERVDADTVPLTSGVFDRSFKAPLPVLRYISDTYCGTDKTLEDCYELLQWCRDHRMHSIEYPDDSDHQYHMKDIPLFEMVPIIPKITPVNRRRKAERASQSMAPPARLESVERETPTDVEPFPSLFDDDGNDEVAVPASASKKRVPKSKRATRFVPYEGKGKKKVQDD